MLSLQLSNDISVDPAFQGRTVMAFNIVAHEVLLEPATAENYELRVNHANAILQRPASRILEYVGSVVSSPSIQSTSATTPDGVTDAEILEGVRQVWNGLIGIAPNVGV